MKLFKRLGQFYDAFIWVCAIMSGIIVVATLLLVDYEVFMRYVLNIGQVWVIEIINNLILYMTFLGVAWLLKEKGHVSINILYARLGLRGKRVNDIFIIVTGMSVCLLMTWHSANITLEMIQSGVKEFTTVQAPKGLILAVIPFGFLTLAIQYARYFYQRVRSWKLQTAQDII